MHSTNNLGSILIASFRMMVSLCSMNSFTVGHRDGRRACTGTFVGARGHTDVTMVPTDEIDMSEEIPTDSLYLVKYRCRLAPRHAFVNICGDNKRISAEGKRRVNEANKIRLSSCPA